MLSGFELYPRWVPLTKSFFLFENYFTGFMVETDLGPVRCKAMLLLSTDDLPARALLTNMKNCNGKSSCSTCHQKGKTVKLSRINAAKVNFVVSK